MGLVTNCSLSDKNVLKILKYHTTVVNYSDKVPIDFEVVYLNFICAIKAGRFYDSFLEDNKKPKI